MSSTILRSAVAAVLLLISTVCLAQVGVDAATSKSSGVFRPLEAKEADGKDGAKSNGPMPVFSLDREYRVGPNDLLDIEILNLENGKRTVRVNAAGAITLPLVGGVVVAGLTQSQIEGHIASLYGDKYLQNPQVSVFIREFTTERITVDGAVAKPGIYPLVGQMTLLRVLALAGGFGPIANYTEVRLFRQKEGKKQVATFDVNAIRSGKAEDPPIYGDDLIVVQRDSTRALLKDSIFRDVIDSINPFSILMPH